MSKVKRQNQPKAADRRYLNDNGIMPRTNISKEITASVKSAYGQKIKVFESEIPHSIRAVEATAEGSILPTTKSGKVAAAYGQFAKEVESLARSKESKIELTAYDDLFRPTRAVKKQSLSKIRDISIAEVDEFPDHPVQGFNGWGYGAAC